MLAGRCPGRQDLKAVLCGSQTRVRVLRSVQPVRPGASVIWPDCRPPRYAFPGSESLAVTGVIAAALENVSGGADVEATVIELAETLRVQLGME